MMLPSEEITKTIVIELHGFNRCYIDKDTMPYLYSLADKYGLGSVEPPFGLEPPGAWTWACAAASGRAT